jgi:hypothetical protein
MNILRTFTLFMKKEIWHDTDRLRQCKQNVA